MFGVPPPPFVRRPTSSLQEPQPPAHSEVLQLLRRLGERVHDSRAMQEEGAFKKILRFRYNFVNHFVPRFKTSSLRGQGGLHQVVSN